MRVRIAAVSIVALTMTLFLGIGLLLMGVAEEAQSWRGHGIQFEGNEATQDNPWGITAGIIDTPEDGRCMLLTPGTGVTIGDFRGEELELDIRIHPWVSEASDGAALGVTYLDARGKAVSQGTLSVESDQRLEYVVDMKLHPKAASVRLELIDWDNHGVDNDWIIIDSPPVESEPEEWRELQVSFVNTEPTSDNPWGFTAGIIDTDVDGQGLLLTSDTGAVLRALKTDSVYRLTINLHPWVAEKSDGVKMKLIYLDAQESVVTEKTVVINKGQKLEYGVDLKRYPTATHLKMLCERREGERVEGDWIMVSMPVPETAPEEWQGLQVSFLNTKATEDNPWGFTAGAIDTDEDGRCLLLTPGTGAMLRELDDESAVRLSMRLHPWVAEKSDGAGLKVAYLDEQDEVVAEDELALEKDQEIQYDVDLSQHPGAKQVRMLCNSGKTQDTEGDWIMIGLLAMETEPEDWQGIQTSFMNAKPTEDNPWGYTAGIIDTDEDGRCLLLTPGTGAALSEVDSADETRLVLYIHPWVAEKSDGLALKVLYLDDAKNIEAEDDLFISMDQRLEYAVDMACHPGTARVEILCDNGENGNDDGDWLIIGKLEPAAGKEDAAKLDSLNWQGLQAWIVDASPSQDNPWGATAGIIDTDEDGQCLLLTPNTGAILTRPDGDGGIHLGMRIHPLVAEASDGAGLRVWLLDDKDNILHEDNVLMSNSPEYVEYSPDFTEYPEATRVKLLCNNGVNDDDSGDWVVVRLEP